MKKRILIIFFSFIFSQDAIYFVYNAKGDVFSVIGDFFHKSLSPKTYPCRLCDLSYGVIAKKKVWKDFLDDLDMDYEFLYKNEIDGFSNSIKDLPIILIGQEDNVITLMSKEEINSSQDINELINKINLKLVERGKNKE